MTVFIVTDEAANRTIRLPLIDQLNVRKVHTPST
jgi:hypothetical protein